MKTRCERQGQVEVGIIEHEGREFVALGSSVVGNSVTGYTRKTITGIALTTWCGKTMLACRCVTVDRNWDDDLSLVFRLSKGKFLAGYALADDGMLFRGELVVGHSFDDASKVARQLTTYFADLDAEDEAEFAA